MQRTRIRSPVGTGFLGEVFSGFFLIHKINVRKLQAQTVLEYHLAFVITFIILVLNCLNLCVVSEEALELS